MAAFWLPLDLDGKVIVVVNRAAQPWIGTDDIFRDIFQVTSLLSYKNARPLSVTVESFTVLLIIQISLSFALLQRRAAIRGNTALRVPVAVCWQSKAYIGRDLMEESSVCQSWLCTRCAPTDCIDCHSLSLDSEWQFEFADRSEKLLTKIRSEKLRKRFFRPNFWQIRVNPQVWKKFFSFRGALFGELGFFPRYLTVTPEGYPQKFRLYRDQES